MQDYVKASLELHLFFGRIMKEHAFFLEVGYTPANSNFIREAKSFKEAFESLLRDVITCSKGVAVDDVLNAGEVITEYTLCSERASCRLTGANLNTELTKMEEQLQNECTRCNGENVSYLADEVRNINKRACKLLHAFIGFKQATLKNVLECKMYTINYPLLLEHIIREAKLYLQYITAYESGNMTPQNIKELELFWNQIMMEHALFIRGLLDPTENDLLIAANDFAGEYGDLLDQAQAMTQKTVDSITSKTLQQTIKYRDFKAAGAKGINECEIRSLILPLLADHVLREANHYIRLLKS